MMFFRKIRAYLARLKQARSLVLTFAILISIISLPWNSAIDANTDSQLSGLPFGFIMAIFILPLAVVFLLTIFVKNAEDIDRHDQDLENE